jgi:hypothetical protein
MVTQNPVRIDDEVPPAAATGAGGLGPSQRRAAIRAMRDHELDVLVVGGGIVGAGSTPSPAA